MNQNVVIGILILIAIGAVGFAFVQTQNLGDLEMNATESIASIQETGTQFADDTSIEATQSASNLADIADAATQNAEDSMVSATNQAEINFETSTASANEIQSISDIATQSAENAIATGTNQAEVNAEMATQAANDLAEIAETATQGADKAIATVNQSLNLAETQSVISTDTANMLATRQIEQTLSAIIFAEAQATADSQINEMVNTIETAGLDGEGLQSASVEIPAGFNLFEGEGYEILLADAFAAGDFVSDKVNDLENALNLADLEDTFARLEKQDDNFLFFAIDTTLVRGVSRATISLIREEALSGETTISEYVASALFSLQGDFALITSDIIPVNGQLAGRIIIDQQLTDASVRQVQYIFMLDNQFYVLTITTPVIEYANLRESLETIASSLRIRD